MQTCLKHPSYATTVHHKHTKCELAGQIQTIVSLIPQLKCVWSQNVNMQSRLRNVCLTASQLYPHPE